MKKKIFECKIEMQENRQQKIKNNQKYLIKHNKILKINWHQKKLQNI